MPNYLDALETRNPQQREADLLARLPALIARAKTAPGWQRILRHVDPRDLTSRAALARLPITRKDDLKAMQGLDAPFGGLNATPATHLRRHFMSPGPIHEPEGRGEDWWRAARALHALGLQAGDLIQNCFSYHFTPAAFIIEGGAARLGCPVIPAGVGQTEQQVIAMQALRPTAYTGTPSFLKLIVERAQADGADISSLRRALVSAEALPAALRRWFHDHGIARVLQFYGSADIGVIAYETPDGDQPNPGMVVEEDILLELVVPGTGQPAPDHAMGEIVVTSFNPDYPMVRWGTGDLSMLLDGPSPCGRSNVRIQGWMGRADQAAKVRGMFIHPTHVSEILRRHPGVAHARMVVGGVAGADVMTLHCETAAPQPDEPLRASLIETIRAVTKLRGEVAFAAPGSLRRDGKLIEDLRQYD